LLMQDRVLGETDLAIPAGIAPMKVY
jgi:hypothetical protein